MNDLISRQAAIDATELLIKDLRKDTVDVMNFGYNYNHGVADAIATLKHLPSAERREGQPSECEYWDDESNFCTLNRPSAKRRGRWVYNANFAEPPFKCSACGKSQGRLSNYCPDCGAKMEDVAENG